MKTNDCRDVQTKNNERELGFFTPFFDDFFGVPTLRKEFREMEHAMKTDVKETDKGYEFDVDLPGYDKKDVCLNIENGYLTIKAQKSFENDQKDKEGNYVRRERKFGSCTRSFYVGNVDESAVSAKLESGVLNIFVPKQSAKQSRIEIK